MAVAVGCSSLIATFARAADDAPPDPELERRSFKIADGFEISLYAADPMVAKPIAMNFDEKGRLWVATSPTYPQVKPGETPNDKVVVLEDTDGDGKADKSTTFADGLLIPTGIAVGDGGAYVANSTEMLHLKDTDGDGKADTRQVVLSGFGTEDTHHIIHTFRWGPDGRLFFNQSIYIHSHLETPNGVRRLNGSGIWRFDPRALELEVYARGMVNPWGLIWDRFGQTFATDGAGGGGIYFAFPGSAFESAVDVKRTLAGMNPGSPKYCSLEHIESRHFPDDWQGDLITNDFRANRIVRYKLSDQEGGYISRQMPDVITSTDRAFRPIDVKLGPDGALYIADWYNPIINHGEVDFRDPRRDHTHGRIWRLTAKGRPLVEKPKLADADVPALLKLLQSPEQWTRTQAKLMLRAKGAEAVAKPLDQWIEALPADAANDRWRLEGLWAHQAISTPTPSLLRTLLRSPDFHIREAATRVLPDWVDQLPDAMELMKAQVADEHPRVRREALSSLARIPRPESIEVAMLVKQKPMDALLDYSLLTTANELKPLWVPAYQQGKLKFNGDAGAMASALQLVESAAALDVLRSQAALDTVPMAQRESTLDMLASIGGPSEASLLMDLVLRRDDSYDAAGRARILHRIEQMARQRDAKLKTHNSQFRSLIAAQEPPVVRAAALRLIGALGKQEQRQAVTQIALAADTPDDVRQAAVAALADLGGAESVKTLRSLDAAERPQSVRTAALAGLAALDLADAANRAAALLTEKGESANPAPLLDVFLKREGGVAALSAALAGKKPSADVAKLALRHLNTTGQADPTLTATLREAAGLGATAAAPTAEEVQKIIAEARANGDAARGELVFRRADVGCFQCHGVGGAGGQLAPDLRALGASSPIDYIVESLLDPNKAVKENYAATTIATKDGKVLTGIKIGEDDKTITLRDAVTDRIVVNKADIRRSKLGGSLMPQGLMEPLTHAEFLDLVRFLSELGKPGPYGPNTAQFIRRWRVLDRISAEAAHFNDRLLLETSSGNLQMVWHPAYAMVSGDLPADALIRGKQVDVAFARGEIDMAAAGKIALVLNDAKGVTMWIDDKPIEAKKEMEADLSQGVHRITLKIHLPTRSDTPLRLEVKDVAGSTGHALAVGGQ